MDNTLFEACKDLIDDVKSGSTDLVFKEVCLEILARAKHVLNDEEFKALVEYASERMREKAVISVDVLR
ncbi:MAG: hypothetical protein WCC63_07410 [Candidatus Bathyarchaeia archaeon]